MPIYHRAWWGADSYRIASHHHFTSSPIHPNQTHKCDCSEKDSILCISATPVYSWLAAD